MPDLEESLQIAYKLLSRRAFSEKALRERLAQKKMAAETIDAVVTELKNNRLLSDKGLAADRAQSRVKNRLLGNVRIEQDVIRKGIPRDEARRAVSDAAGNEDSPSEEERAYQLIVKRWRQTQKGSPQALARRLFGFLARRGFDPEIIHAALERYGRERQEIDKI